MLDQLTKALECSNVDDALDVIFDTIDDALLDGKFKECNQALASININEWSTDLLGGILSITLAASHKLPERVAFFRKVRNAIIKRGELEPGLLDGLES